MSRSTEPLGAVERVAVLRRWARGVPASEAAVELLVRAFGGRFARPGWGWVQFDGNRVWLDAEAITPATIAGLSGGESRLLRFVAGLMGTWPVELGDAVAGVDRHILDLMLAAIAHTAGSHEESVIVYDDDGHPAGMRRVPSLYPWPPVTGR